MSVDMEALLRELFPLPRRILGAGFDEALDRLGRILPMKIWEFPSGTEAWSWKIPDEWRIREAWVEHRGRRRIDLYDHPLHVAIGSDPIDRQVDRDELMAHLSYRRDLPSAIPYRFYHGGGDWGFCCTARQARCFRRGLFHVRIDSERVPGVMKIGEVTVPGEREETLIIPVHLDHPAQANDNLSGVVVAAAMARNLLVRRPVLTTRFLFLSETIGSVAWLSRNRDAIPRLAWAMTIDSVGTNGSLLLVHSRRGEERIDLAARSAVRAVVGNLREADFLELGGYGNDERIFQAPGVAIPAVSLTRWPYREYHTSLDTPEIINGQRLEEALQVALKVVEILGKDFVPVTTVPGPLCLSRFGLWVDYEKAPGENLARERMLYRVDNECSVLQIAETESVVFDKAHAFFRRLLEEGLVGCVAQGAKEVGVTDGCEAAHRE